MHAHLVRGGDPLIPAADACADDSSQPAHVAGADIGGKLDDILGHGGEVGGGACRTGRRAEHADGIGGITEETVLLARLG